MRDSLFRLAASLGTGCDKAAHDAFGGLELGRAQIEARHRGDGGTREERGSSPLNGSAARSG